MPSRKEYEMMFQLGAQLSGSFNGTFKSGQSSIVSLQKEISALNKAQSDISAYQKQQGAVENTTKKLETLQQQYDNIQRELQETEGFSLSLENQLLSKQQQIDKTSTSLDQHTQKLNEMGKAFNEAGVDANNLAEESAQLESQIDALKQKQEEAADEANSFGSTASAAFGAVGQALAAAGIVVALKEVAEWFASCAEASVEFESVMAGVLRTVGGTDAEIAALSNEFKALSTEIPITTSELGGIAETAGQLGIAQEYVAEFTEVMAMLSTTTDLTADNAATMLAQFANITGTTDYQRLGSAVADLGDATATTASKVVDMSQGMAAAASIAGFSETDILAVAAAVGSLGIESQAGSTAMSTLIQTLYKAVETGSDSLTDFAAVAGMTADEFSAAWGESAVSAMDDFVSGLNDIDRNGQSAIVILEELGITNVRQTKAILGLANAEGLLSGTIEQASAAWEENTALQAKADIMYGTTESKLVMMQNAYNNLKIAVGDNYTPALQKLYEIGARVLTSITQFVEEHPALIKAITAFVAVIGAAVAAITAFAAITKVVIPLMKLFAASIPGVGLIMGIAAGVAALTAVAVGLSEATRAENEEIKALTAVSREQYYMIQDMQAEYDALCAAEKETTAEAQLLKKAIEEETAAFEANKQTAAEYAASYQAVIDAHRELMGLYTGKDEELEKEGESYSNLATKLEALMGVEVKTAETKQQILALVDLLNVAVPELGLAYDSYSDSLNMTADALRAYIEAEIERENKAKDYELLKGFISEEAALYETLQAAVEETTAAERELAAAREARDAKKESLGTTNTRANAAIMREYEGAVRDAEAAVAAATEAELTAQAAYDENQAAINELSGAMATYAETSDSVSAAVQSVRERAAELTEAYNESYEAALNSIGGQYEIWDKAAKVSATSAATILSNIQSQSQYWADYDTNIQTLLDKGSEIEGFSDMIASFGDGSAESVNAIAGLAAANVGDLQKITEAWAAKNEAEQSAAEKLADLANNFTTTMNSMADELAATVEAMELSEEAAESGRNTIQGLIDGAQEKLPDVIAAYTRIAQAAMEAVDKAMQINSPSKEMEWRAEMTWAGYIGKTKQMEPEVAAAMAETLNVGTQAFDAESAQAIAFAPSLLEALYAMRPMDALSADMGGSYGMQPVMVNVNVNVDGNADSGTVEALRSWGDDFADRVREVVEDMDSDRRRRDY